MRTLWQLENYIQNKNNFIKVVIVPKLWSPNHILEVIFQMPEAVVSLWELHSCQILGRVLQSLPLVFTEISGILASLRTAGEMSDHDRWKERKDFGEFLCSVTLTLTWEGLFWFEKGSCLWERLKFLAQTQMWSFANALGQWIFFAERSSAGEGWGWILG